MQWFGYDAQEHGQHSGGAGNSCGCGVPEALKNNKPKIKK